MKIAAIALILAAHSFSAVAADTQIDISKFAFTPREITVKPGATVLWTNRDAIPHTIKAKGGGFASTGMDTGDTYQHTFTTAGDFTYFCTMHPFMIGIVHVRQ